jgi:hypothetical protein
MLTLSLSVVATFQRSYSLIIQDLNKMASTLEISVEEPAFTRIIRHLEVPQKGNRTKESS